MDSIQIGFLLCLLLFDNVSSLTTIINDTMSYKRIPSSSNMIGIIDILDEIYIKFDFIVHSFPSISSIGSIIRFGNNENERYPSIFINGSSHKFVIEFTSIKNNQYFESPISLATLYHFEFLITQNRAQFTMNNSVIYDNYTHSHSVIMNRNIYIGDTVYTAVNMTIYGLMVTIHNSANNFNYLCDYHNRFNNNGFGNWLFNPSLCYLSQTTNSEFVSIVWLGDKDILSKQWTDYTVELDFNIQSGATVLILLRAQSIGVDDYGYYYGFGIHVLAQEIRFQYINNGGWILIESKPVPFTIEYNVDYTLRCHVNGNIFNVYLNNEWLFQAIDNNLIKGSIGLRTYKASVIFKSLTITFVTDSYLITMNPTTNPTTDPTTYPTTNPTITPTVPTTNPSITPTTYPSITPTTLPTMYSLSIETSYHSHASTNNYDIEVSETKSLIYNKERDINTSSNNNSWILIIIVGGVTFCVLIIAVCIIFIILRKEKSVKSGEYDDSNILNISDNINVITEDVIEMDRLKEGVVNNEIVYNMDNIITCGNHEGIDKDKEIVNNIDTIDDMVTNDGIHIMENDEFVINGNDDYQTTA
eukprot:418031_1